MYVLGGRRQTLGVDCHTSPFCFTQMPMLKKQWDVRRGSSRPGSRKDTFRRRRCANSARETNLLYAWSSFRACGWYFFVRFAIQDQGEAGGMIPREKTKALLVHSDGDDLDLHPPPLCQTNGRDSRHESRHESRAWAWRRRGVFVCLAMTLAPAAMRDRTGTCA